MSVAPDVAHYRAKHAAYTRSRPVDDPDRVSNHRNLAAATLAERAKQAARTAPPLSAEQIDTIVTILRGGAS